MPTLRQSLVAAVLRRYPFFSGAGSLANSSLVTALAGSSDEAVWCRTPGGEVLAPLRDYVGRAAYFCGDLDPKICWVCRKLVNPGDVACDIGANIGIITLLLSKLVGDSGKVFAFEPNPSCYKALNAALLRNGKNNVEAVEAALGAIAEQRDLSIPTGNAGAASLSPSADRGQRPTLRVNVRTLDEFVAEKKINAIHFMKIDVEGFEGEVLKGSRHVLASLRPQAILFELNESPSGPLANLAVFKTLLEFDYAFLSLPKGLMGVRPSAFNPERTTEIPGHDVIAIPKGECIDRAVIKLRAIA